MQKITKVQDLLPQVNKPVSESLPTLETLTTLPRLSSAKTDQFFLEMNAIYGARWRSNFTGADAMEVGKLVWSQKLSGLSNKQLRRGVDAFAMLSDWNPSVSEFLRAACRLPSLSQCLSRVIDGNNNDPVSYKITAKIGGYSLMNKTFDQIKSMIKSYYDDIYAECLVEAVGNDEEFQPAALLPKESTVEIPRADDETAFSMIKQMRDALDGNETK